MAKSIIAHPAQESTTRMEPDPVLELIRDRSERGLAFFAELFGGEFVEVAPGVVRVPSRSGGGFYDVDLVITRRARARTSSTTHPSTA